MSKEIDTRDFSQRRESPERDAFLHERAAAVTRALPGAHMIEVLPTRNSLTGSPTVVKSSHAESPPRSFTAQALEHVQAVGEVLGFAEAEVPEFTPDPEVRRTSSGAAVVHLYQQYRGIPIFEMVRTVTFGPDRALREVQGDNAPALGELSTTPTIDAAEAARLAAYFLAKDDPVGEEEHLDQWGGSMRPVKINASEFQAHILAAFPMPSRPTVLDKSIFGDVIKAHLVFFYLGPVTRLAWQVEVVMPESSGQYLLIVSADSISGGEILYCTETTHHVAARGSIFTHNPSLTPRTMVDFPRPRTDYPVLPPAGMTAIFGDWVEVDQASGNLTHATLGNTGNTIKGQLSNGVVEFDPTDEFGDDQKVLNIFYFCNYMHDFFYLLGFDELSGSSRRRIRQESRAEEMRCEHFPTRAQSTAPRIC